MNLCIELLNFYVQLLRENRKMVTIIEVEFLFLNNVGYWSLCKSLRLSNIFKLGYWWFCKRSRHHDHQSSSFLIP